MTTTGKIIIAAWVGLLGGVSFGGPNGALPWEDDFEAYTNSTPLTGGTNGWYASSAACLVQAGVKSGGERSAMIPVDCTLSNRFTNLAPANVWLQLELLPSLYNLTNPPVVDTNLALMFYINTSGYFVVHNGPTDTPSNSPNWVVVTNAPPIATNPVTWIAVKIYEDFQNQTWTIYTNGTVVTNSIGFINASLSNFSGFGVYNGATTAYVDSVSVTAAEEEVLSVALRDAEDTADYTTWALGSGKALNTNYIMSAAECVLVKNEGNVAEDFSIAAACSSWTLGSAVGEDTCVLMGLFNGNTAPEEGDFATASDLIAGTAVWATYEADGSGKYQGATDGADVAAGAGEKLYLKLKTPSAITSGNEETITVTIGCRAH